MKKKRPTSIAPRSKAADPPIMTMNPDPQTITMSKRSGLCRSERAIGDELVVGENIANTTSGITQTKAPRMMLTKTSVTAPAMMKNNRTTKLTICRTAAMAIRLKASEYSPVKRSVKSSLRKARDGGAGSSIACSVRPVGPGALRRCARLPSHLWRAPDSPTPVFWATVRGNCLFWARTRSAPRVYREARPEAGRRRRGRRTPDPRRLPVRLGGTPAARRAMPVKRVAESTKHSGFPEGSVA